MTQAKDREPRARLERRGKYFSQQGVALLAVAVAVGLTGVVVAEFSTNTNVDMFAAYNNRDNMKLHFLTRSGMNLSQLIVRVQTEVMDRQQVRQMTGGLQLTDYSSMFMSAFGGSQEEIEGMAAMLGGFSARDMKGLGVSEGRFDVQFSTEDNKINLNCANSGTPDNLYAQLVNLFFPTGYDQVFQNEDAEGWRRTREEQATAIIDYIDQNTSRFVPGETRGTGPEDYGYEGLRDQYRAKNTYLDTVGELRQIRGVDDRFWALFGDAFTVYGDCRLNMEAVEDPMLIAMVIAAAAKPTVRNDLSIYNTPNIMVHAQLVIAARGLGFTFAGGDENEALQQFAQFVANPQAQLEQFFAGGGAALGGQDLNIPPSFTNLLQSARPGLDLDISQLSTVATAGPRRTYRIEAFASIGDDDSPHQLTKRIVGIWDTKAPPPQNTRAPGNVDVTGRTGFGAWVFWRED